LSTPAHTPRGPTEERDLGGVLRLARKGWWAIVLAAVVGVALAALATSRVEPVYESEARLVVGPPDRKVSELRASGQQAQTYAELATSRPVLEAARRRIKLDTPVSDLRSDVVATANDVTRILSITARASTARDAARLASAVPEALARQVFGGPAPPNTLRLVESPDTPDEPIGASAGPMVAVAGIAGALAAFTLLLVADAVRGRVRGPLELADATDAPFLGAMDGPEGDRLVAVRLRLARGRGEKPLRSVVVAGLDDHATGEAAARLADALALDGARTLLLDGQAGAGELTEHLRLGGRPGVADLLGPLPARLDEVAVQWASGLRVVPSGTPSHEPGEDALRELLRRLRDEVDVVVVSVGSREPSPAGLRWARAVSGVLLVARQDRALRDAATLAADAFRQVGATVVGAALAEPGADGSGRRTHVASAIRRPRADLARTEHAGAVATSSPAQRSPGLSGGS
jgi:capsular polysaccharide biosynthesis protein